MRRFIPNFREIVKHVTNMLKKNSDIRWADDAKKSFSTIKLALTKALVLISPYYSREFFIFYFASNDTITIVLLQNNTKGFEQPIAFLVVH